ncbi:hypothetical protein L5515_012985 [Caenorhabditis briggsae]|uniref:Arrestin C-terminal-like domain-containing protein n=1 Tax=Caenorhabditis briggsae TaxID=6238 RepID=A0AAE9E584_CAEBR|nr:hypothetical protein L5515_012985 [Caenorhabditis briggsae]
MSLASTVINIDQHDKIFYPGDEVTGTVLLEVTRPLEARSIVLSIRGKSKTANINLFDNSCVKYHFKKSQLAWVPKQGETIIPAGEHLFNFAITLPADCLPTFHGLFGKNDYKIKMVIDRPWKSNIKAEKEFLVTKKLDLPMRMSSSNWFFKVDLQSGVFFSNGPVTMKVSISTLVFLPGQTVDLHFQVANNSSTEISRIFAKLYQRTHYHFRNQHTPCKEFNPDGCPLSRFQQTTDREKLRNAEKMEVSLAPYSEESYIMPFTFPENIVTPSFYSGLMLHGYVMEFGFRSKGSIDRAMMCTFYMGEMEEEHSEDCPNRHGKEDAPPTYEEILRD